MGWGVCFREATVGEFGLMRSTTVGANRRVAEKAVTRWQQKETAVVGVWKSIERAQQLGGFTKRMNLERKTKLAEEV